MITVPLPASAGTFEDPPLFGCYFRSPLTSQWATLSDGSDATGNMTCSLVQDGSTLAVRLSNLGFLVSFGNYVYGVVAIH